MGPWHEGLVTGELTRSSISTGKESGLRCTIDVRDTVLRWRRWFEIPSYLHANVAVFSIGRSALLPMKGAIASIPMVG